MAESPDRALVKRLREVLRNRRPVTETELRNLMEQTDGLVRTLGAHIEGSERRLTELSNEPNSSLTEIAGELQRVDALRPKLEEAQSLFADLEARARELRTSWLLDSTQSTRSR